MFHRSKNGNIQRLKFVGLSGRKAHHFDVFVAVETAVQKIFVVDVRRVTINKDDVLETRVNINIYLVASSLLNFSQVPREQISLDLSV